MGDWTPEPWAIDGPKYGCTNQYRGGSKNVYVTEIRGANDENCLLMHVEGKKETHPNATRIVACVNALAGVPNPEGVPGAIASLEFLHNKAGEMEGLGWGGVEMVTRKALKDLGIETEGKDPPTTYTEEDQIRGEMS